MHSNMIINNSCNVTITRTSKFLIEKNICDISLKQFENKIPILLFSAARLVTNVSILLVVSFQVHCCFDYEIDFHDEYSSY